MQRSFHLARSLGALTLLISLLSTLAAAPAATAQEGMSSLEVHDRICPEGYEGSNYFEDCHDTVPDPGLPFTFTNEDTGETYSDTTNENGNVGFANLSAGTYTISGGAPGEFANHAVYCAVGTEGNSNQQQIPVTDVTTGVQLELPADTNVICDWYDIPENLAGTAPAAGDSSIEVHNRICPEGYEGEDFFADCHDNVPDPGLSFTFTDGVTREGTTNENGNVGFANLPTDTYTITGGAPGEFTDYAVYCAVGTEGNSNQEQIPVEYVTGGIQLDLPASTNVICDWYTIPVSQRGDTTQEQFDLPIFALACDTEPDATARNDFVMMGTVPSGCEQYAGASVTVSTPDGSTYGTCETSATDPCYVTVATGANLVATIDTSTLPADTMVLGGDTQKIEIPQASEAWVLFVAVPAVQTPEAPTATAAPLPPGRSVEIVAGTCKPDGLTQTVVDLTDLRRPSDGDTVGQPDAIVAETSTSTIPVSLDDLLASDHVVVAYPMNGDPSQADPVACAPIGGQINDSGELVLGMREMNGSGYAGIVYMAPTGDGSQTGVTVFLAEGLAGAADDHATPTS